MSTSITTEINRLNSAVNEFKEEMKEVLSENAAEGKRGWDQATPKDLFRHIEDKMKELKIWHINCQEDPSPEAYEQAVRVSVDLANLSMMYRIALKEGR